LGNGNINIQKLFKNWRNRGCSSCVSRACGGNKENMRPKCKAEGDRDWTLTKRKIFFDETVYINTIRSILS